MDTRKLRTEPLGELTLKELSASDLLECLQGDTLDQKRLLELCIRDADGCQAFESADDIPARIAIRALPIILSLSSLDTETIEIGEKKTKSAA